MINKNKLISELEDVISCSINKIEQDKLLTNWISLINNLDVTNYRFSIKNKNCILIKHKAFNKKVKLEQKEDGFYINNKKIVEEEINFLLPVFFY